MAIKIEKDGGLLICTDTTSNAVVISKMIRNTWYKENELDSGRIVFYDTDEAAGDNITGRNYPVIDLSDAVDIDDVSFTENTFRLFAYEHLTFTDTFLFSHVSFISNDGTSYKLAIADNGDITKDGKALNLNDFSLGASITSTETFTQPSGQEVSYQAIADTNGDWFMLNDGGTGFDIDRLLGIIEGETPPIGDYTFILGFRGYNLSTATKSIMISIT